MEKKCLYCGKVFMKKVNESVKDFVNRHKYCSKICFNKSKIGNKIAHLKEYQFKNGEHSNIDTEFKSENVKGSKNVNWKGDNASYYAKHIWIGNNLGKANHCEKCGCDDKKRYHWHNIDKKYTRDKSKWISLCPSCHRKEHLLASL